MALDVRPEVVEDLVQKLAGRGTTVAAVEVGLLTRQLPQGVTETECRWALQRFRGMALERPRPVFQHRPRP